MGTHKLPYKTFEYKKKYDIKPYDNNKFSVTELTSFLTEKKITELKPYLDELFTQINPPDKIMKLKNSIKSDGLKENVADINGIIIPTIWEYRIKEHSSIYFDSMKMYKVISDIDRTTLLKQEIDKIVYPCQTINDYLHLGNVYLSIRNGHQENLNQIKDFNWLKENQVQHCIDNIDAEIDKNGHMLKFEMSLSDDDTGLFEYLHKDFGKVVIMGVIDVITDKYVYENKCKKELSNEDKLQIILYAWIYKQTRFYEEYGRRDFRLFNFLSGEVLELDVDNWIINSVVEILFQNKMEETDDLKDEEFIRKCLGGVP
tara:strand:- start:95 stop:1039 length:945 start_codon:yes stop_codon:yes gene_type:complete